MSTSDSRIAPRAAEQKIRAGFALAFVLLTLAGAMAWTCSMHSREQFLAVERSRQVLAAQAALQRELAELEVVVRGYFVTGNPIYMEQYAPGIPAAHRAMRELRQLTAEDDEHRSRLPTVSQAVQRKLALLQNYVDFRDQHTTEEVFAVVRQMKGKLTPDEARDALDALAAAERRRLAERAASARRMSDLTIGTVLVGGVLGLAIVGLAQRAMWRELRHRRDIERELEAARAELERRVRARTAELAAFAQLGRQLNACSDVRAAGRLIVDVADGLFGWDACTFDLFDAATGRACSVLNVDLVNGQRTDVPSAYADDQLSPRMRRALTEGAELILRESPPAMDPELAPFGDAQRPSASLMIAPIRDGDRVVGVFSIQSYRHDAYTRANLDSLQALADHCGGALQRLRSRTELQRERNLLRTLIDIIPDSIYVRDRANRFVLANEAVARNMGAADPAALLGRSDVDFYDPAQAERLAADDRDVLAGQAKLNFEEEITDRAGERRVVLSSKVPWRDASGEVTGLVGIGRNITERKRMEEALRASEELLRTVTDTAGVGLVIVDRQHRYRYANPAYASILRLPSHDLVGQRVADVLPLVYADQIRPRLERAFATGRVSYELTVPPAADNMARHYAVAYEPTTERAEPLMVVVIVDITERKRAEEALAREHLLVAAVVEGTSDAVFVKDLAGRYQMVNAACARALGRSEGDILGRTDAELLPPETARRFCETDAAVLASGTSQMREEEGQMPDGTHYWLANKSPWRDPEGRLRGIIGVSRDITERKRSEQQLEESREQLRALLRRLQRAQAEERARVAREIHDELGQLLTGLKMDTRWIERKLSEPGLSTALHPLLDRAVAASELADRTIATVQELAAELRPSTLDQLGLAAALAQMARTFATRTGIPCSAAMPDAEPDLPPETQTELFYICQEALTNIARHAQASQASIQLVVEGDTAVLTVGDDGTGLGATDLSAPRSLGLLGMRERAGQCGGEVKFLANEPHGTRVVVRVPMATAAGKGDQS